MVFCPRGIRLPALQPDSLFKNTTLYSAEDLTRRHDLEYYKLEHFGGRRLRRLLWSPCTSSTTLFQGPWRRQSGASWRILVDSMTLSTVRWQESSRDVCTGTEERLREINRPWVTGVKDLFGPTRNCRCVQRNPRKGSKTRYQEIKEKSQQILSWRILKCSGT